MFEDMVDGAGNSLIDNLDSVDGLKFAIDAGQGLIDQRVVVDRFEVIPEPATMCLLGLGALLLRGKKK